MKKHLLQRGFTLVEMMVSVALFATVISVALPTMIVVMKASARAQALQTTIDNTSFALDAMSRQVRLGKDYRCTDETITPTEWNTVTSEDYHFDEPLDCVNGASTLIFLDQYGTRQAYRFNSASSTLEGWHAGAGSWIPLTSPRVLVDTAKFMVTGAPIYDGVPPLVNFTLRGAAKDEVGAPPFTLSTSMTQYASERSFAMRQLGQGAANINFTAGASLGAALTALDDIDGNGVSDILVGMPGYNGSKGGAQVLFMLPDGNVEGSLLLSEGTNGMPSFSNDSNVGAAVASLGDIDGDDTIEVLIGAPGYATSSGAVYVTTLQDMDTATDTVRITPAGLTQNDAFGASIASLTEGEVVIGAPGDDDACQNCGAIYIAEITASKTLTVITKIATGLSLSLGDAFGSSVAYLGRDFEDRRMLLVGAQSAVCANGNECGAVYLLHLTSANTVDEVTRFASVLLGMPTLNAFAHFGIAVPREGVLDNDGIRDYIIGAEEQGGTGSVYVLFMNLDETIREYRRVTSGQKGGPALTVGDAYGSALATMGDLNGDLITDFLIGAPGDGNSGAFYVLFGK